MKCGEVSRAAKILCSQGLADESSQTVKKLEEKHPKSTFKPVYNCPSDIPDFSLDEDALMQKIRNALEAGYLVGGMNILNH